MDLDDGLRFLGLDDLERLLAHSDHATLLCSMRQRIENQLTISRLMSDHLNGLIAKAKNLSDVLTAALRNLDEPLHSPQSRKRNGDGVSVAEMMATRPVNAESVRARSSSIKNQKSSAHDGERPAIRPRSSEAPDTPVSSASAQPSPPGSPPAYSADASHCGRQCGNVSSADSGRPARQPVRQEQQKTINTAKSSTVLPTGANSLPNALPNAHHFCAQALLPNPPRVESSDRRQPQLQRHCAASKTRNPSTSGSVPAPPLVPPERQALKRHQPQHEQFSPSPSASSSVPSRHAAGLPTMPQLLMTTPGFPPSSASAARAGSSSADERLPVQLLQQQTQVPPQPTQQQLQVLLSALQSPNLAHCGSIQDMLAAASQVFRHAPWGLGANLASAAVATGANAHLAVPVAARAEAWRAPAAATSRGSASGRGSARAGRGPSRSQAPSVLHDGGLQAAPPIAADAAATTLPITSAVRNSAGAGAAIAACSLTRRSSSVGVAGLQPTEGEGIMDGVVKHKPVAEELPAAAAAPLAVDATT